MISVTCSACNATIQCKDEHAGRSAKCPKCRSPIRVPVIIEPEPKLTLATTIGLMFRLHCWSPKTLREKLRENSALIESSGDGIRSGVITCIAITLAIVSMFMKWIDVGVISWGGVEVNIFSATGFTPIPMSLGSGAYFDKELHRIPPFVLLALFIYPLVKTIQNRRLCFASVESGRTLRSG